MTEITTTNQIRPDTYPEFKRALADGVDPDAVTDRRSVTGVALTMWQDFYLRMSRESYSEGKMISLEPDTQIAREMVRKWNVARGKQQEQLKFEEYVYWQQLRRSHGPNALRAKITNHQQWQTFRNENGANPVLYALRLNPMVLELDSASELKTAQAQVDNEGRDLWFYMLSSSSTHQRQAISKIAQAYPPQLNAKQQGWLSILADYPVERLKKLNNHGFKTLDKKMFRQPERGFFEVLAPGDMEMQKTIVERSFDIPTIHLNDWLGVLHSYYRALHDNLRKQLLPELELLMLLGHPGATAQNRDYKIYQAWQHKISQALLAKPRSPGVKDNDMSGKINKLIVQALTGAIGRWLVVTIEKTHLEQQLPSAGQKSRKAEIRL